MAINVSVQFEITTVGDGENHDEVFNWPINPDAPRGPSKQLVNGNGVVVVPSKARGVIIVPPTTNGAYNVKGLIPDAGIAVTPGGFLAWRFNPNALPLTLVVTSGVAGVWSFYWC